MELTSSVPRHFCAGCGAEIGYQSTAYVCYRTKQAAPPHTPVARRTPKRPKPPEFNGPDLNKLLGVKTKRKDRPASKGILSTVDFEVGPVAGRLEWRCGAPRPAGDT